MPKISIITAAYIDSQEKQLWLDEMIQSVLSQSFQDWEMVIVDDKSPKRIDRRQLDPDSRIRLIHSVENQGPAITRNTAVNQSVSSCLFPLDSDDKLPHDQVLEQMYDAWNMDKSQVVYGNLQVLTGDKLGDIIDLGSYSFEAAMGLKGTMPVSCMHGLEVHQRLGGWKSELQYGREDVEYWLNAGKLGFCGYNIGIATLIYRRHETSRDHRLKHVHGEEYSTEQKIREIHSDIYEGRFPMGCCGGKGNNTPAVVASSQASQNFNFSGLGLLPDVPEDQKMWIEYRGRKQGGFSIRGLSTVYRILGTGYQFEAYKADFQRLRVLDKGQSYVEILSPAPQVEEPAIEEIGISPAPTPEEWPEIPVAQIERMDSVAMEKFGLEPETVEIPMPLSPQMPSDILIATKYEISDLGLGKYQEIFEQDNWTVESVAMADPKQLSVYKGIGPVKAVEIITKANELIK